MKRSQIRIGDELMLGHRLVEVKHVAAWKKILDCVECRPHGAPAGTKIFARPEDLSSPVKIRETKLQRDAIRLARWWSTAGNDPKLLNNLSEKSLIVFSRAYPAIGIEEPGYFDLVASIILSEVM